MGLPATLTSCLLVPLIGAAWHQVHKHGIAHAAGEWYRRRTSQAAIDEQLSSIGAYQPDPGCQAPQVDTGPADLARGPPRQLLVVSMIMSSPQDARWRDMIRQTLPELAGNVEAAGHRVQVVTRFAVGRPPAAPPEEASRLESAVARESADRGDVALLNITDGSCDGGKNWHLFEWAARHYPEADLVFKQDDDTIVRWGATLDVMLGRIFRGRRAAAPLRRLYLGRLCPWAICGVPPGYHCANGNIYGLSGDIARWVVENRGPTEAHEDILVCIWAHEFMFERGCRSLDPRGLLYTPDHDNAFIHRVKSEELYRQCYHDRENGCTIANSDTFPYEIQHFKLPARVRDSPD